MKERGFYILDEHGEPKWTNDIHEWARAYEQSDRRVVAQTTVDHLMVSTVFLGLDHNFSHIGPPILWETMVFEKLGVESREFWTNRCSGGREQAECMHQDMIDRVKAVLNLKEGPAPV